MSRKIHFEWHSVVLAGLLALFASGARAQDATFSLDADYTGRAWMYGFSIASFRYYASGDVSDAPSGLTNVGMYTDVYHDPVSGHDTFLNPGWLTFTAPGGARLFATLSGSGTFESYAGTFTVTEGTDRFKGSTGSGTFDIRTPGPAISEPATISIRGTATGTAAAIPEPSTLALLGLSGVPLALRRRGFRLRRFRSSRGAYVPAGACLSPDSSCSTASERVP